MSNVIYNESSHETPQENLPPLSNQQLHDMVSDLFTEYRTLKRETGAGTHVEARMDACKDVIGLAYRHNGRKPSVSVLDRLGTYLILDHLTDSHPDKMSREEIPVMSGGQTKRYFEKAKIKSAVESREDALVGRRKRAFVTDDGANWVTSSPMDITSDGEMDAVEWQSFLEAILSAREYAIVQRYYGDGDTQGEIAAEMGVSRQRVGVIMRSAFDKIRRSIAI